MKYIETELIFTPSQTYSRSLSEAAIPGTEPETETLGIVVRLGNKPLVYNLKDLASQSGKSAPPAQSVLRDNYLVVHAISAIRTSGRARVDELQYLATAIDPGSFQTIDLIPKTRFNEVMKVSANLTGALRASGETDVNIPAGLTEGLIANFIEIGADMKLQLSSAADFVGKFTYSIQLPVVQSGGIGSNTCTWILNPDENKTPLLGDQLLVQSISVSAGCKQISYKISGAVKADKGIFWKQREKKTPEFTIDVQLASQ